MIGTIHGRLTKDPELRTGNKNGKDWTLCNFSVASDNQHGDGTSFYECYISGKQAEALNKYFSKGKEIVVYGEIRQEPYDKDGKTYRPWKVRASGFEFCGSADSKSNKNEKTAPAPAPESFEDVNEDIPF